MKQKSVDTIRIPLSISTPLATQRAVLLVNLGSPRSPSVADVRSYLNEFLMDRHVLSMPWPMRRAFVSLAILPFRPQRSAQAYHSIWRHDGSPLIVYSQRLQSALAAQMQMPILLAMRYGEPSIAAAMAEVTSRGITELLVAPLYPQHADSTRTTTWDQVNRLKPAGVQLRLMPPFYAEAEFIESLATISRPTVAGSDHILFSYHGLPERHLESADPTGSHCLKRGDCCERPSPAHATCYRHQCFRTMHSLASTLQLAPTSYSIAFQSRLGPVQWLRPYTDEVLRQLPQQGVKRLAVICPAFVADNLETLEEIGIRGREIFLSAGGQEFCLAPCLNDSDVWARALAVLLERQWPQP